MAVSATSWRAPSAWGAIVDEDGDTPSGGSIAGGGEDNNMAVEEDTGLKFVPGLLEAM